MTLFSKINELLRELNSSGLKAQVIGLYGGIAAGGAGGSIAMGFLENKLLENYDSNLLINACAYTSAVFGGLVLGCTIGGLAGIKIADIL